MIIGILAAVFACLAYGVSSVMQAYGARSSKEAAALRGESGFETETGAPTMRSTMAAALTTAFIIGTVLDVIGFGGSAVSARLVPLFLSQTIVSANLVVTAVLGIFVLGINLHTRDWLAIAVVIVALFALGISAESEGHGHDANWFHWGLLAVTLVLLAGSVGLIRWLGSRAAVAAGLCAGTMFGAVAIAVRILDGISDFDVVDILTDPAAYALAIAGVGGYYLHTVALQLGSVNGATAALVVGETVVPGLVGIIWLGDNALPGRTWLAVLGFVFAVVGAVTVAWSGAVEASAQAESGAEKAPA
jgi:hypothetical protein